MVPGLSVVVTRRGTSRRTSAVRFIGDVPYRGLGMGFLKILHGADQGVWENDPTETKAKLP